MWGPSKFGCDAMTFQFTTVTRREGDGLFNFGSVRAKGDRNRGSEVDGSKTKRARIGSTQLDISADCRKQFLDPDTTEIIQCLPNRRTIVKAPKVPDAVINKQSEREHHFV